MEKALLYKEWKKTRIFSISIALVAIVLSAYIMLKAGRSFRIAGMEHLWDVIVNRKQFIFKELKYFPIAAGLCIGFAQYFPEIVQKRIKLSLHLPLNENKVVMLMHTYGMGVLLCVFFIQMLAFTIFSSIYFPFEFMLNSLQTIAPWYLAGFVTYMFVAMICLEPVWNRRGINSLLAIGTIYLFLLSGTPAAYEHTMCLFLIVSLWIFPFGLLSIKRFKEGKQG
ncbi:hypothetical protein [Carboxylicivirga sp. N1Y90]|uniref:hypothetical protein n=1 Tax=Carboxylicivirga fragile TaxID=3417571 RepID=UPI003D32AEEA|nr:hypothetical protein [Marinilabiliaceae bacterium N1Y90]